MANTEHQRKCAKCHISADNDGNSNIRFHRFPLPGKQGSLRPRVWAEYCFPDKNWSTEEALELYKQHKMLCSQHFDESSYTSSSRSRLNKFAIPAGTENIMSRLRQEECETLNETVASNDSGDELQMDSFSPENMLITQNEPCATPAESEVPQTGRGILRELDRKRSAELSPYKRKLYLRCSKNLTEIMKLRQGSKDHQILTKLLANENVQDLLNENISESFALLLQSQLKNTSSQLIGHRWTVEDKVMALKLYKKSNACYRLLRCLFCLPCEVSLKALLNRRPMNCGINDQIFKTVKDITQSQDPEENLCILAFDEKSICKNLNTEQDIDDYQDHDNESGTIEPATHVLLFMAIGMRKKWKQPLAFYFSDDCLTPDRLSALIKEVLEASFQAGLRVVATVCDNLGVNVRALNSLGSSVAKPYFEFNGHEIVTIIDPPHLIKSFRNNFLKYDIGCSKLLYNDGKPLTGIAKWVHIKEFYEKDNANPNFVFAPALTVQHIEPKFKQKLKVSLAAQVLSHSVAAGMLAKIANNELPEAATVTAMLVGKMDQLFDALNGDTDRKSGKKYLSNITQRSPHLTYFNEMKVLFQNMTFLGATTKPPLINGFIRTLNAVERLFDNIKTLQIGSLSTRRLNQDPLENCFECIRSNCGYNASPLQFVAAFKIAMISNLLHNGKNKNCEDDDNAILNNLKSVSFC